MVAAVVIFRHVFRTDQMMMEPALTPH